MPWFDRFFGTAAAAHPPPVRTPADSVSTDAVTAARSAAGAVLDVIMTALKDERGIHLESLFCALGAVAGYACQVAVRADAGKAGLPEDGLFQIITAADGQRFFFGDALNRPLAEDRLSVWSLVAGAAAHDGARRLPDLTELFKHNAASLGSEAYGVPRLPAEHPVQGRPVEYARKLWPLVRPVLAQLLPEPRQWPVCLGLAIQDVMARARGTVPPEVAALIVMESAIPVSKLRLGV